VDDADCASNRARVSPRFEVVSASGYLPLRYGGCFVGRVPERDEWGTFAMAEAKSEIGGGIEHRIAAQDDERLDPPAFIAETTRPTSLRLRSARPSFVVA